MNSLFRHLIATLAQRTGKRYPALEKVIEGLSEEEARDFQRLLQDLEGAQRTAVNRARQEPWRR